MKRIIDPETWNRKEHFEFFIKYDEAFFGFTVRLSCKKAYSHCKEHKISFYPFYLYCTNKAVNEVQNFKYRIEKDQIVEYDKINVSATMARPDNTFGFSYIEFDENFEVFYKRFRDEKERVMGSKKLFSSRMDDQTVHYTSIPWIDFTSMSHARNFRNNDSCPKISFGKLDRDSGSFEMPVSIHAHHALVDGFHIGKLIEKVQFYLDHPESFLNSSEI